MKNKEKYKELLEDDWGKTDGEIKPCSELPCDECDFKTSCALKRLAWLNLELCDKEYKEKADWSKVPVDTRVLVSGDGKVWLKRHFAGYEDGECYVWKVGQTSWSTKGDGNFKERWNYIGLAEGG